ncbi:hypothetical protein LEMLEM_LOCUS25464 [Lemmus lemmus]
MPHALLIDDLLCFSLGPQPMIYCFLTQIISMIACLAALGVSPSFPQP